MGADQHIDWHGQAASVLEWWRDAGVDVLVEDDLRDWFAAPASPAAAPAAAAPAPPPAAVVPDTLDAFLAWRMGEHAPEERWNAYRLPVAIRAGAPLMIVTDLPEESDSEAGAWMTGPVGMLLDRMLAACGLARADVAIAGVAWARPLSGRIPMGATDTLADLARRLVTLAEPRRVLLFGPEACQAILGADGRRGGLRALNHGGLSCPTIATLHPRFLLERPQYKGEAWRDLQLLFRETDA
ncbi:uracil-DNA glycosylase family protein [Sphingomonas silueang]|uniref:uracil-DNA glycosylase family protein n=1 Tax=Sphingomonas silueang TaxID=3156617 RepID=UPI0032B5583D